MIRRGLNSSLISLRRPWWCPTQSSHTGNHPMPVTPPGHFGWTCVPVQDEQGKQEMWWRGITAMVQGRPQPRADLVALLDANGRVGSISSLAVGAVGPQEEDAEGEMLHDFLGKCDLMAANTTL